MKEIHVKKKHLNIRKGGWIFATFSLIIILSFWSYSPGAFSKAASGGNPLFSKTLEQFYRDSTDYNWSSYNNSQNVSRNDRLKAFASYYYTYIKSDIATKYNWPLLTHYEKGEVSLKHNETTSDKNHDLYLVEFSTANEITNPNIDLYWSLYYIEKSADGSQIMKYTSDVELSKNSRDFMGRKDRNVEFQKGEVEMSTVCLPKESIPVGIFVWQKDAAKACPWEISYLNIYKVDTVSDIYDKGISEEDPSNFYRVVSGTRTGYIDQTSLEARYMSLSESDRNAGKTISSAGVFEWLYPLTPANDKVNGYLLEVVTYGSKSVSNAEHSRSVTFTIGYDMETGSSQSFTLPVNFETVYKTHPYTATEDYDSNYDFTFGDTYVNPIARTKITDDSVKSDNANLKKSFPYNNLPFRENYDMQYRSFTKLPSKTNYAITDINEFAAMMLGNYFDAYTLATGYLKEYQATQIPISLPAGIKDFTRIAVNGKNTGSQGIQSIRIIELAEPLSGTRQFNGFFSSEEVLGFKGNLIAESTGSHPNMSAVWSPDTPGRGLKNYSKDKQIALDTQSSKLQGITVKFSDIFGAGMENVLADMITQYPSINPYNYSTHQAFIYVLDDYIKKQLKDDPKKALGLYNILSDYLQDPLTLTVTYRDLCDDIREVHIPFLTAYLMQLMMDNGNSYSSLGTSPESWLSGIFQQGQTAGLRLNLSEFKSLISVKLYYGYGSNNPLNNKLRSMEGDAYYDDDQSQKDPLQHNLENDSIAIDSICFYNSVTPDNFILKKNGLIPTIQTSLTPTCSWQSSSDSGHSLSEDKSFTIYRESRDGNDVNMHEGAPLETTYQNQYLVEITTLNTDIAATVSDLSYQIHFTDIYGTSRTTTLTGIHASSKDFYGFSSRNLGVNAKEFQSKLQYALHLQAGAKLCFVVTIPNLKTFDGITLVSDGLDEWQPDQIQIMKLTSLKERTATKVNTTLGKLSTPDMPEHIKNSASSGKSIPTYRWDREYNGVILASAKPNILLHSGRTSARINFTVHSEDGTTTPPEAEVEEVQYLEKIPTTMTYEDTLVDLGLNIVKNTYQVHVDVANVNDAGSSNYFYFQLLFENGRSGLVLANQQLPADSFRQGLTETFEIKTTQRYGALRAVRIICEATASTASTFDKLNINKITVTLNSNNGTGKSWIVDRVGWVNINYVDEVRQNYASSDNQLLENQDLILDFPVTSISSSTELMFCISTGKLSTGSQAATMNMTSLGDNIEGIITYTDFQNATRTLNLDLPKKIMDFNENESTSRILRTDSIDRFLVTLPDVKQIQSLTITRTDGKTGDWPIKDITIQKVGGVGDVYLSAYTGEYIRQLGYSEYLTTSTSQNVLLGVNDSKTFAFDAHTIEADIAGDDDNSWNTTITRYPVSSDESLNIYLYLTDANGNPYKLSPEDSIDASVIYSSSLGTGPLRASFKNIRLQSATTTSSVLYAQQLPITYLGSLKSMELLGNFSSTIKPVVKCAYVEHVQGNVIKDILYLPYNNTSLALDKVSATFSSIEALTPMKQIVRLQPKEGTSALLTPETSDIAVALRYTSSLDPENSKMVYQSPYVFLTDAQYMILNTRDRIEIPFQVNGIGEIIGLTVISNGPTVEFENALICNYPRTGNNTDITATTTLLDSCSIAESFVSTNIISKMMKNSKLVTPVTFTFTTPKEDLVAGSGTTGIVGMEITYTDSGKIERTYTIDNILDYLPLDNPPFSDTTTSFNILMTDVAYINSITLTPTDDDWFLAEVNAKILQIDGSKQTTINKTAVVNQWAKKESPLTIDMRPDSINTDGPVINKISGFSLRATTEQSDISVTATSGNPLYLRVVAGDKITFKPTFQKIGNPTTNINWSAFDYEAFFTDYSDGSAIFNVPSEDAMTSDNLPREYSLSAVCSENNSLAIPITIEVVTQEELDNEKDDDKEKLEDENSDVTKLSIMVIQDEIHLKTKTFSKSDQMILDITPGNDTTFEFVTSLNTSNALLSVSNSKGEILSRDDAYKFKILKDDIIEDKISDYNITFNIVNADTEETFSVTVKFNILDEISTSESFNLDLYNGSKKVANKTFSETSLSNQITYKGKPGNTIKYLLGNTDTYSLVAIKDDSSTTTIVESYTDKIHFTDVTDALSSAAPEELFIIPTLSELNSKLGTKEQLSYDNNGEITVPFRFKLTVIRNGVKISGEICINVTYQKELTLTLLSAGTAVDTMNYTPAADSFKYDALLGKSITCNLTSTDASKYKLKATNDNAKAFLNDEQTGTLPSSAISLLTIPETLTKLNKALEDAGKATQRYGSNGTVTVPFKFTLYEVYTSSSGSETTKKVGDLQINATYQKEMIVKIKVNGNTNTKNFTVSDTSYSTNAIPGDVISWQMASGMDVDDYEITANGTPATVTYTANSDSFTIPTFDDLNTALKNNNKAEIKPDNGKANVSFKFDIQESEDENKEGCQLKGTITINVTYTNLATTSVTYGDGDSNHADADTVSEDNGNNNDPNTATTLSDVRNNSSDSSDESLIREDSNDNTDTTDENIPDGDDGDNSDSDNGASNN